jgi:2-oxoglutarate ferredoxin oxidoreductase subunit gamma
MKNEIRISGFGGQGVALAALVLGKAATLYEDLEGVMTQSYGPEARGGASSADVILSDAPIAYPFVQQADILIALSQEAYKRYRPLAKKDALVLIDQDLVQPDVKDIVKAIPATRLAEGLGRRIVTNIVMLGFLTAVSGLVKRENMEKALEESVKAKTLPLNLKAFATGFEYTGNREEHHE